MKNIVASTEIYSNTLFKVVMTRNKFQPLLNFLHFHGNENMPQREKPGYDIFIQDSPSSRPSIGEISENIHNLQRNV